MLTRALRRHLRSHLVAFSDSRQGAARVAANLELAHYLDLVRALSVEVLTERDADPALARAHLLGKDGSAAAGAA